MNKEEFQQNRQFIKDLQTSMFNTMHDMYDRLEAAERRVENARIEGYGKGYKNGYRDGMAMVLSKVIEMAERKEE